MAARQTQESEYLCFGPVGSIRTPNAMCVCVCVGGGGGAIKYCVCNGQKLWKGYNLRWCLSK